MSNDLSSQQLRVRSQQMAPVSALMGSAPNVQMGLMGSASDSPSTQQFPVSSNSRSHGLLINKQGERYEDRGYQSGSHQLLKQTEVMEAMLADPVSQFLPASNKRKEPVTSLSSDLVSSHSSAPKKQMSQLRPVSSVLGHSTQLSSASNKRAAQMPYMLNVPRSQPVSAPNKKFGHSDSFSTKVGAHQTMTPKGQNAQTEPSQKPQIESFESVRAKMRETLVGALEMVSQQQDKTSNGGKDSPTGTDKSTQPGSSVSFPVFKANNVPGSASKILEDRSDPSVQGSDGQGESQILPIRGITVDSSETCKQDLKEFQLLNGLPGDDVSFSDGLFVKDELLQGNGLSWALEISAEASRRQKEVVGEKVEKTPQTSQYLGLQIEAELFKLFGGVNKKYKEKGRSLLFNLKDRSNPELRERVMSGHISPKRLCSMTAEELASKELSQWRIAKAEEFDKMVVLPDTDADVKRLVKKTHKGEFQVEVAQDDSALEEVSAAAINSLSQARSNGDKSFSKSSRLKNELNVDDKKDNSENLSSSVTVVPHEGADPMQGLEFDELKDTKFLPPIVSLDEFMESLDSEPPFENLSQEAGKTSPIPCSGNSGAELRYSEQVNSDTVVDKRHDKPKEEETVHADSDSNPKSSMSNLQHKTSIPSVAAMGELIWEGLLQLSIPDKVTVNGFFKSGEKTTTKEWPDILEIKGRVRLNAFEKFIQELPNSRSRSMMVVHFLLKDKSCETDQQALSEVVGSYVSDDRLGFAEPVPGVEIYICPIRMKMLESLKNQLAEDASGLLNSTTDGLIGVVVWRKPHPDPMVSPKSSSHSKHSSKKQQHASRKPQEKEPNPPPPPIPDRSNAGVEDEDEDEDDVPPGFGPGKEEDDLPEFNFNPSSNVPGQNPPQPAGAAAAVAAAAQLGPQTEQLRALIQKYGQSGVVAAAASRNWQHGSGGLGNLIQPWEDEDDDIPEWQPQAMKPLQTQPTPFAPPPMIAQMPPSFALPLMAARMPPLMHDGYQQQHQPQQLQHQPQQLQHQPQQLQQPQIVVPPMMQGCPWGGFSAPVLGHGNNGAQYPSNLGVQVRAAPDWRQGAPRSTGF